MTTRTCTSSRPSGGSSIVPQRYDPGDSSSIHASIRPFYRAAEARLRFRRRRRRRRARAGPTPSSPGPAPRRRPTADSGSGNANSAVTRRTVHVGVRHVGAGGQASPRLPARPHATSSAPTSTTSASAVVRDGHGARRPTRRGGRRSSPAGDPAPSRAGRRHHVGDRRERPAVGLDVQQVDGNATVSSLRRAAVDVHPSPPHRSAPDKCAPGPRRPGSPSAPPPRPARRRRSGAPSSGRDGSSSARRRATATSAVGDHARNARRAASRDRSRVLRPGATCATWRARSTSCFIVRTKSPPVSSSTPTTSRPSPATHAWAAATNPGSGGRCSAQAARALVGGEVLAHGDDPPPALASRRRREPRRRRWFRAAVLVHEHRQQPGELRVEPVEPAEHALGDEQVGLVEDVGEHLPRSGQRPAGGLVAAEVDVVRAGRGRRRHGRTPVRANPDDRRRGGRGGRARARCARPARPAHAVAQVGVELHRMDARRPPPPAPSPVITPRSGRRSARARRLATSRR